MTTTQYFYLTKGRHIARLDKVDRGYNNAEILYDNHRQKAFPADLLWNMEPVTKSKAIDILVKWHGSTRAKALELMNGVRL